MGEYMLLFTINFSLIKYKVCDTMVETFHFIIIHVGICRFPRSSMLVCMSPLNVVMITMMGLTFQHCVLIASCRKLYLSLFTCMAWSVIIS